MSEDIHETLAAMVESDEAWYWRPLREVVVPVEPRRMRYCSEDQFLGQADVVHPCEYLAEHDGEECDCEIENVLVYIVREVTDE